MNKACTSTRHLARYFDRHGWQTTTFPEIGANAELERWCEAQGVVSTPTSAVLPVPLRTRGPACSPSVA